MVHVSTGPLQECEKRGFRLLMRWFPIATACGSAQGPMHAGPGEVAVGCPYSLQRADGRMSLGPLPAYANIHTTVAPARRTAPEPGHNHPQQTCGSADGVTDKASQKVICEIRG